MRPNSDPRELAPPSAAGHPLWRLAALGLVTGAVGYLVRSLLAASAEHQRRDGSKTTRPVAHDVGRWENEGGMVATSVPVVGTEAAARSTGSEVAAAKP